MKLSTAFGALGLVGVGMAGSAAADTEAAAKETATVKEVAATETTGATGAEEEAAEQSQPRDTKATTNKRLQALINDAMRSGDSKAALAKYRDLRLTRAQQEALLNITAKDWDVLSRYNRRLRPLRGNVSAGDPVGVIIY